MCAEGIHSTCKSKTLITALNHLGMSVSYDEIARYHSNLPDLVCNSVEDVPLPSHLNPDSFTTAAFDNFDHEEQTISGIGGSHDTVSVLYQDKPEIIPRKLPISETDVVHGAKSFQKTLRCQELKEFLKPAKRGDVPSYYTVCGTNSEAVNMKPTGQAWSLSHMNLSKINEGSIQITCEEQQMPSWNAFNSVITKEQVPERIVGFLPILPFPVTRYDTVYTALKNFQNVLSQLTQNHLAVTCDGGVYRIAREILLLREN